MAKVGSQVRLPLPLVLLMELWHCCQAAAVIGSGPRAVNVPAVPGAAGAAVASPDLETTVVSAADAVTTSPAADSISITGDAASTTMAGKTELNSIKTELGFVEEEIHKLVKRQTQPRLAIWEAAGVCYPALTIGVFIHSCP